MTSVDFFKMLGRMNVHFAIRDDDTVIMSSGDNQCAVKLPNDFRVDALQTCFVPLVISLSMHIDGFWTTLQTPGQEKPRQQGKHWVMDLCLDTNPRLATWAGDRFHYDDGKEVSQFADYHTKEIVCPEMK